VPDTPTGPGSGKLASEGVPSELSLANSYPNPFNSSTVIEFGIPEEENILLVVYDLLGRKVATLIDKPVSPGYYSINWDGKDMSGTDVPSGVYFAGLSADGNFRTVKMTVLR
jgi:flagellar hook assembly protein FlgD